MSLIINKKKINNLIVHAGPQYGGDDNRPPKGEELFKRAFCRVYLDASSGKGKTSNIFFILKRCMSKKTKLIIFCSTVDQDPKWLHIVNYFKEKGVEIETHTSLKENNVDYLNEYRKRLENEAAEEKLKIEEKKDPPKKPVLPPKELLKQKGLGSQIAILKHNVPQLMGGGEDQKEEEKKPTKSKYKERKYMFVLDDLSTELKTPSLVGFLKVSRHYGMVILSSQYYKDILPASRMQIDYFLIYKGETEEKLEAIFKDANMSINYDTFLELYKDATQEKHSFLYISRDGEIRENFNKIYEIPE